MESRGKLPSVVTIDWLVEISASFTEKVDTIIAQNGADKVSVNYNNPVTRLMVMDEHSPPIKVAIHGQEVTGSIVDRGSRVNVIIKLTCDQLGITKWDACPFQLRMVDTSML